MPYYCGLEGILTGLTKSTDHPSVGILWIDVLGTWGFMGLHNYLYVTGLITGLVAWPAYGRPVLIFFVAIHIGLSSLPKGAYADDYWGPLGAIRDLSVATRCY